MHPLAEPLRESLPLVVGAAFVVAFVPLVARQSEGERTPPIAKLVNNLGRTISASVALVVALLALWYASASNASSLFWVSYGLLMLAFITLLVSFFTPAIINLIPPLWERTYYDQFEKAQAEDLEEVKKAAEELKDEEKPKAK